MAQPPSDSEAKEAGRSCEEKSWFENMYARYIPDMVIQRFMLDSNEITSPEMEEFEAAVAFVDISGFTKLSESLVKAYGKNAAEQLDKIISGFFRELIGGVKKYGGDIIKFAGDAMLVVWRHKRSTYNSRVSKLERQLDEDQEQRLRDSMPSRSRPPPPRPERRGKDSGSMDPGMTMLDYLAEDIKPLILRAVKANLELLEVAKAQPLHDGVKLELHCGIGAGNLKGLYVGGEKPHSVSGQGEMPPSWEFFVAGNPIEQISKACDDAVSGQVFISEEAYELIKESGIVARQTLKDSVNYRVFDLRHDILSVPLAVPVEDVVIPPEVDRALCSFVPPLILARFRSEENLLPITETVETWLAEYRTSFIMFVGLPDKQLKYDTESDDVLFMLQKAVKICQRAVFEYEGTVARLLADDKGTRFKIVFGMPTLFHEDDAMRVVKTALDIEHGLKAIGMRPSIGIATGLVYCGAAGSKTRCEYTPVGFKVILAARLMGAVKKERGGGIFCEELVFNKTKDQLFVRHDNLLTLKGVEKPIPVFIPTHENEVTNEKSSKAAKPVELLQISNGKVQTLGLDISGSMMRKGESYLSPKGKKTGPLIDLLGASILETDDEKLVGRDKETGAIKNLILKLTRLPEQQGEQDSYSSSQDKPWDERNSSTSAERLGEGNPHPRRSARGIRFTGTMGRRNHVHPTRIVIIEGESGIGKTALIQDCIQYATKTFNITCVCSGGVPHEQGKPFFPFRGLLSKLFDLEEKKSANEKTEQVEQLLDSRFRTGDQSQLTHLLNPLLDTNFKESTKVKSDNMTGDARAKNTRVMLINMINHVVKTKPHLVVLEDLHWIDSASWALLLEICNRVPNMLLMLSTRPFSAHQRPEYQKLQELKHCQTLRLDVLKSTDSGRLVCKKLNVQVVPPTVVDMIYQRAHGHPLFTEELAQSMLDSGMINVNGSECTVGENMAQGLEELPSTMNAVILSRLDHLEPDLQFTMKICAVIGRSISSKLLCAIHPSCDDCEQIKSYLKRLESLKFLQIDNNDNPDVPVYIFKVALYQEVAYEMLTMKQQKLIHTNVADFFLKNKQADISQYFGFLAYHWEKAGDQRKALEFAELAGRQALMVKANDEAVRYFSRALQLMENLEEIGRDQPPQRVENCHIDLAEAFYSMGRPDKAIVHYNIGLEMNGTLSSHTRSQTHMKLALAGFTFKQFVKSKIKKEKKKYGEERNNVLAQHKDASLKDETYRAARILEKLVHAHLLTGKEHKAGQCAIDLVYLAERLDNHALQALGYAHCSYVFLILKKRRANNHKELAQAILDESRQILPIDRATAMQQIAMNTAAHGKWTHAFDQFKEAKELFKQLGEHKKWREMTLLVGVVCYFLCNFDQALMYFEKLRISAKEDGDTYLEIASYLWKSHVQIAIGGRGTNVVVENYLDCAHAIAVSEMEISFPIARFFNRAYSHTGIKDPDEKDESAHSPKAPDKHKSTHSKKQKPDHSLEALEKTIRKVKHVLFHTRSVLWYQCNRYFYFVGMCLQAHEWLGKHGGNLHNRTKRRWKMLEWAESGCHAFRKFCESFPYAKPLYYVCEGRLDWAKKEYKRAKKKWREADHGAYNTRMFFVVALANYELMRHESENTIDRVMYTDQTKRVLDQCNITYWRHPFFTTLTHTHVEETTTVIPLRAVSLAENPEKRYEISRTVPRIAGPKRPVIHARSRSGSMDDVYDRTRRSISHNSHYVRNILIDEGVHSFSDEDDEPTRQHSFDSLSIDAGVDFDVSPILGPDSSTPLGTVSSISSSQDFDFGGIGKVIPRMNSDPGPGERSVSHESMKEVHAYVRPLSSPMSLHVPSLPPEGHT